jgi:hypothetical protein
MWTKPAVFYVSWGHNNVCNITREHHFMLTLNLIYLLAIWNTMGLILAATHEWASQLS